MHNKADVPDTFKVGQKIIDLLTPDIFTITKVSGDSPISMVTMLSVVENKDTFTSNQIIGISLRAGSSVLWGY